MLEGSGLLIRIKSVERRSTGRGTIVGDFWPRRYTTRIEGGITLKAKGFWSYARGDNDHLENQLTELRQRIAGEVSMLLGTDISMFQDVYDLRTGDLWKETLRGAVSSATFLVPVLTPRYYTRE